MFNVKRIRVGFLTVACVRTDVDECVTPANNCKFACKNLIGSFACICPEGYAQVPGTADECRDVNECATGGPDDICRNGYCVNTPGAYKCDCYDGFKASADGKRCIGTCADGAYGNSGRKPSRKQCVWGGK